jgi:hypothetical protein
MPEWERKIYDGIIRLPRALEIQFGKRVKILADYRSAVFFKPTADPHIVALSLRALAEMIEKGSEE